MRFSESVFAGRFSLTRGDLEKYLAEALSQGGDYADLYFEYIATSSISVDESIVKSASRGVSMGVGVRVIAGERTGYAYSDDISPEKIRKAARELIVMMSENFQSNSASDPETNSTLPEASASSSDSAVE